MADSVRSGSAWGARERPDPRPSTADGDDVVVEELTLVPPARLTPGSAGRVVPLAAVVALVAALGLGGRLLDGAAERPPGPSASPVTASPPTGQAVLALLEPAENGHVAGPTVTIRGEARDALGTVHVAVVVGSIVLGATDVVVAAPGPVTAAVPVVAGTGPLTAAIEVSRVDGTGGTLLARRTIVVRVGAPVQVWRAVYVPGRPRASVEVDGFAPLTVPVVTASARDGALREASTTIRVWPVTGSASPGAATLGLAVFHVEVSLASSAVPGAVTVTWKDALDGTSGWIVTAVAPPPVPAGRAGTDTAVPEDASTAPRPRSSP